MDRQDDVIKGDKARAARLAKTLRRDTLADVLRALVASNLEGLRSRQFDELEKALGIVDRGPQLCRQCSARDYTSGLLGQIRGLTAKVERLEEEVALRKAHEAGMITEIKRLKGKEKLQHAQSARSLQRRSDRAKAEAEATRRHHSDRAKAEAETARLLGQIRELRSTVERLEEEADRRSAHEAGMVTEINDLQHQLTKATAAGGFDSTTVSQFIENAREALDRLEDS